MQSTVGSSGSDAVEVRRAQQCKWGRKRGQKLNWAPSLRIRDTMLRHLNLALKSARFLSTGTSEEKPVQKMGRTKEIPDGAGI